MLAKTTFSEEGDRKHEKKKIQIEKTSSCEKEKGGSEVKQAREKWLEKCYELTEILFTLENPRENKNAIRIPEKKLRKKLQSQDFSLRAEGIVDIVHMIKLFPKWFYQKKSRSNWLKSELDLAVRGLMNEMPIFRGMCHLDPCSLKEFSQMKEVCRRISKSTQIARVFAIEIERMARAHENYMKKKKMAPALLKKQKRYTGRNLGGSEILNSTIVGKPFPIHSGMEVFPLAREPKTRSFVFLNEVNRLLDNGIHNPSLSLSLTKKSKPVIIVPGMVFLGRGQNKIIKTHEIIKPGSIKKIQMHCVDPRELNSSKKAYKVAPYLADSNCLEDFEIGDMYRNFESEFELHGAHQKKTKNHRKGIKRITEKFSEEICSGYILKKDKKVLGFELFDNPRDFNALARHFSEFLFGPTYSQNSPYHHDRNLDVGKYVLPGEKVSKVFKKLTKPKIKECSLIGEAFGLYKFKEEDLPRDIFIEYQNLKTSILHFEGKTIHVSMRPESPMSII